MTTANTSSSLPQLREDLVRSIKQFSLTYEQHQLIHSSEFGPLVAHIRSQRKPITIAIMVLALFASIQAARGLMASSTYVPWLVCALVGAFWAWRRHRKVERLDSAYDSYVSAMGDDASQPNTLASELRLAFRLHYPEFQAIHAGDAHKAAHAIITRRRANTKKFAKGVAVFSVIAVLIWGVVGVFFAVMLLVGLSIAALIDRYVISKVERLLERYPEDSSDGEQPHDHFIKRKSAESS